LSDAGLRLAEAAEEEEEEAATEARVENYAAAAALSFWDLLQRISFLRVSDARSGICPNYAEGMLGRNLYIK
jgi:hypothetical protein